tara:strand:+ start:9558 stop:10457 length:900 start_codon:yes stop_codon:yes gene_type:complete
LISDTNPEYYFKNKALSINEFRKHIKFFKKHYEIIKLEEALKICEENKSLENKLVITFDDGFKENYSKVAPILYDEGISATFFMITSCIDNRDLMWRNKILLFEKHKTKNIRQILDSVSLDFNLPKIRNNQTILDWSFYVWPMKKKEQIVNKLWELIMPVKLEDYLIEKKPYCSIAEIKEMYESGFEIGSHSHTHPIFNQLNYDDFYDEIIKSGNILSSIIGSKVRNFSYPFGNRASEDFENKFNLKYLKKWSFLGTKNNLNNLTHNHSKWERDNLEFTNLQMKTRFLFLPIFRSLKGK